MTSKLVNCVEKDCSVLLRHVNGLSECREEGAA
jgi:hypothetical protein